MVNKHVDSELVKQAQQGNNAAFDILVLKYQHKLLKSVGNYIKDQSEAKDVVQDTFIKAYGALEHFRGDSSFYTWIYRIAINTAKNYLSYKGRRPPNVDIDIDVAEQSLSKQGLQGFSSPESYLEIDDREVAVLRLISQLPAKLKQVITLREIKGLSYAEIAQEMKCPIGTVRSRIFRARQLIDKEIKKQ